MQFSVRGTGRGHTAGMRSHLRAWRWLLALLVGMALLQPLVAVHAADAASHCASVAADAGGPGDEGHPPLTACAVCAALPALERRPDFAAGEAEAPTHALQALRDRALPPETPPPIR